MRLEARTITFNAVPFVTEAYRLLVGEFQGQPPTHAMTVKYQKPVSLLTGGRGPGRRVEHARLLRVARLERRVARRAKRPVRSVAVTVHLPSVAIEVA